MRSRTFISAALVTVAALFSFAAGRAAAATAGASAAPTAAPAASGPIRHLVYSFTYGSQQSITARDSANPAEDPNFNPGGGSGASHYSGSLGDIGTMTVNVLREQPDKGLVLTISEQGENIRKAPAATCVVYGNTEVICDPNKTVFPEEYTLLRFLGSNFVDPNNLDAQKQWSLEQTGAGMDIKSDYTILNDVNGLMSISETRKISQPGKENVTTNVESKIGYDFNRLVPTSVNEYVTRRTDNGVQGTSVTIYQTQLKLVTDSMAKT
jgi:hypothetical protein